MKTVAWYGWRLLAACMVLSSGMAVAQTVLGTACGTFPAVLGQRQTVTLSKAASAGQLVVVAIAVDAAAQLANTDAVSDSAGNSYPIETAAALDGGPGVLLAYAGRATAALNAGGNVTVSFFSTGSVQAQSCVEVTAFPGVLPLASPDDAYGANHATSNALTVTSSTSTQHASELVYSVFASAGTPGTIGAAAPAQDLAQLCTNDNTLCMLPAWNLGATAARVEMAGAAAQNSVPWGALLITFQSNDRIFANGFE